MKPIAPLEFEKPLVELERKLSGLLLRHADTQPSTPTAETTRLQTQIAQLQKQIYGNLTPWQRVQIVRHPNRPYTLDYINLICSDFTELHGDRLFGDDKALIGGLATIDQQQVLLVGQQKGRNTKESLLRNFGCAHPEGYRKALRLMRLASKFKLPVVCFIDTPGAYPGVASEERHVAEAIAVNIREMFNLSVPVVAVVIGEGGSGGAMGIGVADRVLILENAYYSVISPEGCAGILWKDRAYAPQAAAALKMTSPDLKEMNLVDEVIAEPMGGAHRDWESTAARVKEALLRTLKSLSGISTKQLLEKRQKRYRNYGPFDS